jgi:hypothetical protein
MNWDYLHYRFAAELALYSCKSFVEQLFSLPLSSIAYRIRRRDPDFAEKRRRLAFDKYRTTHGFKAKIKNSRNVYYRDPSGEQYLI